MTKPPSAAGPSSRPPEGRAPHARPPEATPPAAQGPAARRPESKAPSSVGPGVNPDSFTRHTKITAGVASTPQQRQQIAEAQARREAAAEGMTAYAVAVDPAGTPANDSMVIILGVTYTVRPLPGPAVS
jgi:hypothetical protein